MQVSEDAHSHLFFPSFSIVIEWENFIHAESWRPRKVLQQICKQIIEIKSNLQSKPELIFVYNSEEFGESQLKKTVNELLAPCKSLIELKIKPAPGLDYTAQKNFGAQQCHNDIVIFIDCDVIPGDGWLVAILKAFQNSDVKVVAGSCFMVTKTLVQKAFALFWTFEPPSNKRDHICEEKIFFANNVAFRCEVLESYPLPDLPQYRGQNTVLSNQLWRNGIRIFHQPKAKVYHPPPNGLRHFVIRALCQGHDIAVARRRESKSRELRILNNNLRNRRSPSRIISTMRKRYRHLDLKPIETVWILSIVFGYYAFMFMGMGLTSIKPEIIRNHFSM